MNRLVRNIGYNVTGQLLLLALSFVSVRYIFTELGKDVLGIIYFTLMLNALVIAVLELGVTTTTVKEVSTHRDSDPAYVVKVMRSGAFLYWIGYVLAAITVLVAAPAFVSRWITLESLSEDTAVELLRILGVSSLLALPQTFYVSVFRGLQRMGITNVVDVGTTLVQQVGIVVVIRVTGDLRAVAVWIASTYVLRLIVLTSILSRLFGWTALAPRLDREIIRRNRGFASHMIAITILATVHTQTDKLMLSRLLPVGMLGIYGLLYGTLARGGMITSAVAQGAFPTLTELAASTDRAPLLRRYHRLQDLLCYGLVPPFAFLAFATLPLFSSALDSATAPVLVAPAALLALGFYLNGTLTIPYFVTLATNRPDIGSRQNVAALFATLPVTLIATWKLGLVGAAGSWVWYQLFAYAYSVPLLCRECLGISPWQWYRHELGILALVAGTYGVAALVLAVTGMHSTAAIAIAYAAATLVFGLASWRTMAEDSRRALSDLVRSALRLRTASQGVAG